VASLLLLGLPAAFVALGVWRGRRWRALLWVIFVEGISISLLAAAASGALGVLLYPMFVIVFALLPAMFVGCLVRPVVNASRSRLHRASSHG
jgi:hypothetical protein